MNDSGVGMAGVMVGVVLSLSIGGLWAAAWLLGGFAVEVTVVDAVTAMVLEGASPPQAWDADFAAATYWVTVALLNVMLVVVVGMVLRVFFAKEWGTKNRERLGSSTESEFASTKDLETLWSRLAPGGRFLLGRTHGLFGTSFGSKILSAEWKADPGKKKLSRRARRRENDRGAVMLLGVSRSGKSVTALTGIHYWDGPVVLSSVKDDLVGPTLGYRRTVGEVAVFDPVDFLTNAYADDEQSTQASPSAEPGALGGGRPEAWDERLKVSWSPLRDAANFRGAGRAARALADSGPEQGGQNQMWVDLAEQLLQGLMFVASNSGRSIRTVTSWVMSGDSPQASGDEGEVLGLLMDLVNSDNEMVADEARAAFDALNGIWSRDQKIVSSVYTTAMSLVNSWLTPSIARSATGRSVDLEWLCSGNNSLYLVASPEDAAREAPVFGGMVTDLLNQAFARVARTGKPIDPPLLVVLDEAGNLPLARLPEFASTVAGLGVQLVTAWQSLAQVQALYRERADIVIANHLTKISYGGSSDETTLKYMEMLVGEEEVETQVNSDDKWRWWQGSMQVQGTRLSLAPSHTIRQMPMNHALMVHGTLKPAYIHSVPWYKSDKLLKRMKWDASDDRGLPETLTSTTSVGDDYWPEWDEIGTDAATPVDEDASASSDVLGFLGLR